MRREWGAACPPWPVSGRMQDRAAGPEQPPGHTGRKAAGQCCAPRWGRAEFPLPARGGTSTLWLGACQVCPSASGLLVSSGVMGAPAPQVAGGEDGLEHAENLQQWLRLVAGSVTPAQVTVSITSTPKVSGPQTCPGLEDGHGAALAGHAYLCGLWQRRQKALMGFPSTSSASRAGRGSGTRASALLPPRGSTPSSTDRPKPGGTVFCADAVRDKMGWEAPEPT